jgi:hypothetical protein
VEEAKVQLPKLAGALQAPVTFRSRASKVERGWWHSWLQPAFAAPVLASLLLIIGYQNLVTYPGLRAAANQPRLLPWAPLRGATRGAQLAITADRQHGVALPVDLPQPPSIGAYSSYSFNLNDPQGKLVWTGAVAAPSDEAGGGQRLSLVIPGAMLSNGTYPVRVTGVTAQGERIRIDQYVFDLHLTD